MARASVTSAIAPRSWWLAQQPARVRRYFAGALTLAVALTAVVMVIAPSPASFSVAGVATFGALALAVSWATRSVMVAFPGNLPVQDIGGVWMLAALLLWGPYEALALALLLGGAWTQYVDRHWGGSHRHPAQQILNVAAMFVAVDVAFILMRSVGDLPFGLVWVVGALGYLGANAIVVFGIVHVASREPIGSILSSWSTRVMLLTEGTLSVGIAAAWRTEPLAGALLSGTLVAASAGLHYAHLLEEASTDQRTGLLRPDNWTATVERLIARDRVAVILADLDHFKSVNDRFGHLVGDEVLTSIGATIASELRPGDIAGRWGGEEFVVALPGLGEAEAREVADRLADAVRRSPYGVSASSIASSVQCTISAGVATAEPTSVEDARAAVRTAVRQADTAMYAAKRAGRDRTLTFSELNRPTSTGSSAWVSPPHVRPPAGLD